MCKFLFITVLFACSIFMYKNGSAQTLNKSAADSTRTRAAASLVESNPDNLQKHEQYLRTMSAYDPAISKQYDRWMKTFPKAAMVFYAYSGVMRIRSSFDKEKDMLKKTISLDPHFLPAWERLLHSAYVSSDDTLLRHYAQQLMKLDTANTAYAIDYASSYAKTDSSEYHRLLRELAIKYPSTETGAKAIFRLAWDEKDPTKSAAYYEWLRKDFSTYKVDPFVIYTTAYESGMIAYYKQLVKDYPEKALQLAEEVWQKPAVNQHGDWRERILMAKNFISARWFINDGKTKEALALLDSVKPRLEVFYALQDEYFFLKLKAYAAGSNKQRAYDSTLIHYASYPDARMMENLFHYGSLLGKNQTDIQADVKKRRLDSVQTADNFYLTDYLTGKKVSLRGMRGKTVLLTYWFPACGPCKGEFEHFENVLKKFSREDVVYVAINLNNAEQDAVVPLIKAKGYTFIPLQDDPKWDKGNLSANAAPINYLISKEGKIIFDHFMIREIGEEQTLERMIRDVQVIHEIVPQNKQMISDSGNRKIKN